jgi:hypothetical protein
MPFAQRPSRQIRPCRAPLRLIVNGQPGSKAYRLDRSLQTHFSEPVMRQNSLRFLAPAGTASRSACSRWPVRGQLWE